MIFGLITVWFETWFHKNIILTSALYPIYRFPLEATYFVVFIGIVALGVVVEKRVCRSLYK